MGAFEFVVLGFIILGYVAVAALVTTRHRCYSGRGRLLNVIAGALWPVTLSIWHLGFALGTRRWNGQPIDPQPRRDEDGVGTQRGHGRNR